MVGTVDMYKLHLLGVSENGLGADCKSQIRDYYANYTSLHFQLSIFRSHFQVARTLWVSQGLSWMQFGRKKHQIIVAISRSLSLACSSPLIDGIPKLGSKSPIFCCQQPHVAINASEQGKISRISLQVQFVQCIATKAAERLLQRHLSAATIFW
jgi:hypothetical protein